MNSNALTLRYERAVRLTMLGLESQDAEDTENKAVEFSCYSYLSWSTNEKPRVSGYPVPGNRKLATSVSLFQMTHA